MPDLIFSRNRTTFDLALAVLPPTVVKFPSNIAGSECCCLHLKLCMRSTLQVAHNEVQTRSPMHSSNNLGAIPWGFQQLSPRYGVLSLDALVSNWVQLLQLARRNLRPEIGSRRPGCEYTYPVNQPPLAKAPLGSGNERVCADKAVPEGFKAQRAYQDGVLGSASRWTI